MAVTEQKQLFFGLPLYCQLLQGRHKKCDKHSIKFKKNRNQKYLAHRKTAFKKRWLDLQSCLDIKSNIIVDMYFKNGQKAIACFRRKL